MSIGFLYGERKSIDTFLGVYQPGDEIFDILLEAQLSYRVHRFNNFVFRSNISTTHTHKQLIIDFIQIGDKRLLKGSMVRWLVIQP
jgi:hypothetical protein